MGPKPKQPDSAGLLVPGIVTPLFPLCVAPYKSYTSIPHITMVTSGLPVASYFNHHPTPKVLEWLCGCPILQQPRRKGFRSLSWLLKEARAGREAAG